MVRMDGPWCLWVGWLFRVRWCVYCLLQRRRSSWTPVDPAGDIAVPWCVLRSTCSTRSQPRSQPRHRRLSHAPALHNEQSFFAYNDPNWSGDQRRIYILFRHVQHVRPSRNPIKDTVENRYLRLYPLIYTIQESPAVARKAACHATVYTEGSLVNIIYLNYFIFWSFFS